MEILTKALLAIDWSSIMAVIGTGAAALMAVIRKKQAAKAKQKEVELHDKTLELNQERRINEILKENIYTTKLQTLKQLYDVSSFSALEKGISHVFQQTSIDRFTVLFLMNGKHDFNFMSVLFDQSKKRTLSASENLYQKVPIDDQYRNLVIPLTQSSSVWITSPFERAGKMAQYLALENVQTAAYFKVRRIALDDFNDILVFLCWTTESEKPLTWQEKRIIELNTAGKIVPILSDILAVPAKSDATDLLRQIHTDGKKNQTDGNL